MVRHTVDVLSPTYDRSTVLRAEPTSAVDVTSPEAPWLDGVRVQVVPALAATGRRRPAQRGRVIIEVRNADENRPHHTLTVFADGGVQYSA